MSASIDTQASFEQRLATLAKQDALTSPAATPTLKTEPKPVQMESTAEVLNQLVGVVAQLARMDKTIAQVTEGAPDTDEAKQWHQISLQALQCSRNVLIEKQSSFLKMLNTLASDAPAPATAPEAPKEAKVEVESEVTIKNKPPPGLPPPGPPPGLAAPEPAQAVTQSPKSPTWMGWSKEAVEACPEFVPPEGAEEDSALVTDALGGGSLRQDLETLRACQPERVLIVRKIKKLGFESPTFLTQHFEQYGAVSDVRVAHSHVKPTPKRPNGRVRPAALGFVVMGDMDGVENALNAGEAQEVAGVTIELSRFTAFTAFEDEE